MPGTVLGAGNIEMTNKNLCQDWGKVEQSKEYEDIQGGGGVAIFNEILVWAKFSRGLLGNVSLSEKKRHMVRCCLFSSSGHCQEDVMSGTLVATLRP